MCISLQTLMGGLVLLAFALIFIQAWWVGRTYVNCPHCTRTFYVRESRHIE